jgi:signal transduction histidine kinase
MKSAIIKRPNSIAGRLLIFSCIFVTLALVIASVILWLALKTVIREQIDQRLDMQIGSLANAVTKNADGRLALNAAVDGPPFDRPGSGWYWQIEGSGQRLTSRSLVDGTIAAPPVHQDFLRTLEGSPIPAEGEHEGQALYLRKSSRSIGGEILTITVSAPQRALVEPALRALLWLVPCMLLLGIVLMLGTLWQVRFGLKPLKSMGASIDAINRGERNRVPEPGVMELSPLALKTNVLLEANEERLAATRIQFANLAHGLKTPVASLLLALGTSNDPEGSLRGLVTRIDQRIKHHLSAARRVMVSKESSISTNLARSLANLHLAISQIHLERRIAFNAVVAETIQVACDESDLEEMLGNLLDNAFKWASSRVAVVALHEGNLIRIDVVDDGPGIRPDRAHAVLLPGVREDERIPGNGFGLTIVAELAGLYGGSLSLEPSAPAGLDAILTLPAARQFQQYNCR